MSRRRQSIFAAVLILANLLAFLPALDAQFLHWDDNHNIYANPQVQTWSGGNVWWMFSSVGPDVRYKPLTWLTWGTIDALAGQNPKAFHAANLLLHTLNGWLLFLVLLRLGRLIQPADEADLKIPVLAGGAVLLWSLHPLRVEPVAWASCTAHGLCFFFCLLATRAYLSVDREKSVWNQGNYWWSLAWFLIALLAFPLPLGFGAVFLALNVYPFQRLRLGSWRELISPENRRVIAELIPFLAASVLMVGVALYCRWSVKGTFGNAVTLEQFPLLDRLGQAAYVWVFYLWKTLLPLNLSPVYLDLTELSFPDWPFVASMLVVASLVFIAWRNRSSHPGLAAVLIAHLGILVPVLGLTERPHFPGDRYSLIDGAILMSGFFGFLLLRQAILKPIGQALAGAALVLALGSQTFKQTLIWLNDRTLFQFQAATLADGGQRGMAYLRLAATYQREGDLRNAAYYYGQAEQTHPGYPDIDLFLPYGVILESLGDLGGAARRYQHCIRLDPKHPEAWKRLGLIFIRAGEFELAAAMINDSRQHLPNHADFLKPLAEAFLQAGQADRARHVIGLIADIDPDHPDLPALKNRLQP